VSACIGYGASELAHHVSYRAHCLLSYLSVLCISAFNCWWISWTVCCSY